MDLHEQLKKLFPDHQVSEDTAQTPLEKTGSSLKGEQAKQIWVQSEPMICKYEKRKGKPTTIIEGYQGSDEDFKLLAKELKTKLSVGGTFKDDSIIIQGDYRDKIMQLLQQKGFKTKRVGG